MSDLTKKLRTWGIAAGAGVLLMIVIMVAIGFGLTLLEGRTHYTNDTDDSVTFMLFAYDNYERNGGKIRGPFTVESGSTVSLWESYPDCIYFPDTRTAFSIRDPGFTSDNFNDHEPMYRISNLQTGSSCSLGVTPWEPGTSFVCEHRGKESVCTLK